METITKTLTCAIIGPGETIPAEASMTFDPSDPLVIHVQFTDPTGVTDWIFGRELLATGMDKPTGEGDVRIRPSHVTDVIYISLWTPEGAARIEFATAPLATFLHQAYELCPLGTESFDTDAFIASCLGD